MSKRATRYFKLKIIAICLLIVAIGGFAVMLVFNRVIDDPDNGSAISDMRLAEKNGLICSLLYSLYRSENSGLLLINGDEGSKDRYMRDMLKVYELLDSLRAEVTEPVQKRRVDSIADLIVLKEHTLWHTAQNINLSKYYADIDHQIEDLMPDSNEIKKHIVAETIVNVRRDTFVTKHSTGNFFSRLKGVFKKNKVDSTVVTTANVQTDSVHVSLADSINVVLSSLKDSVVVVHNTAMNHQQSVWKEISSKNAFINGLIFRLLNDIDMDETAIVISEIARQEMKQDKMVNDMTTVVIVAFFLSFCLIGIICYDLNQNNRYRKQLEQLNREKEQLLDYREKMMLAMTHDIKAPLSSIIGYTDLLQRITENKRQRMYVSSIKSASDVLLELVTDLLEFYRLDSGKMDVCPVAVALVPYLQSFHDVFYPLADKKHIELDWTIDESAKATVFMDPLRVKQIVNNLISNAIKFTDKGRVHLFASLDNQVLEIRVADTGRGISEDEKTRLFDMFVRLSSSKGIQGFGLGLSIVDRTVKLLGGGITVESQIGEGSVFAVRIPVKLVSGVDGLPSESQTIVVDTEIKTSETVKVLLIDDDMLQMDLVSELCRRHRIVTDKCQYPTEVERFLENAGYDMVITDIQMPDMSGFDVLKTIRRNNPAIPVVAVTARMVKEEEFTDAGFAAVLSKPFKESDLIGIIQKYVGADNVKCEAVGTNHQGIGALVAFADGDVVAQKEILTSFIRETEENMLNLSKAVDSQDRNSLKSVCHKMLPMFVLLGAVDIERILRKYDVEAENVPWMTAEEKENLFKLLNDLIELVKQYDGRN